MALAAHVDIDVLAFHPKLEGPDRVIVVSCKSWQHGFNPKTKIAEFEKNKQINGRDAWRGFRELLKDKWSEAFCDKVLEITGSSQFTHWTVVTVLKGDNLNMSRYISTATPEDIVDLQDVHMTLADLEGRIGEALNKHNFFLTELGLPLLPQASKDRRV